MATTLIKFRQGTGTPAVGNATGGNSIGEPLWSTDLRKLYVTDGASDPVLIGPGPNITVTPENIENGTSIATITVGEDTYTIKAPTSGSSVTQELDVVNSNETNPTLITLDNTNSIELESSIGNPNVTTVIAGMSAAENGNIGKAKLLFDVQINVIDGGTWTI